jgi:hypothetical protein
MTNPIMAVSNIEPSSDRLITPAFSVIVSPNTAKTIGGEAARTAVIRIERSMV